MGVDDGAAALEAEEYCREVEAYLCRKNDGHLIRVVGPAFELVSGWASQGIPLRVAFEGIDRFFERYYRKGTRRRPVHISFCEADVLDVFDAWRRATGVPVAEEHAAEDERARRGSLSQHLDRAIVLLTARRPHLPPALEQAVDDAVRELDVLRAGGRTLRGDARSRALDRLRELDGVLAARAREALSAADLDRLAEEAKQSVMPFRARMDEASWSRAREAALDGMARAALRLPVLAFEG